jgi:hypothetical protein
MLTTDRSEDGIEPPELSINNDACASGRHASQIRSDRQIVRYQSQTEQESNLLAVCRFTWGLTKTNTGVVLSSQALLIA